jgi:CBS domain-containing protein
MNTSVSQFYNSPIVFIEQNQSIQQAAILMTKQQFSCLVVTQNGEPTGIVTDKDIRRRCVAQGLATSSAVSDIMTTNITSIDLSCNAHDALMTMAFKHLHHLPVTEKGKVVGMVSATDLMANEGHNAINLSALIYKATNVEQLVEISLLLPKLQYRLVTLGSGPDYVGKNISALTRAFTKQLISLAQEKIGQAPVPFVWLATGSQARQEQLVHSDQDNALLISDAMKPEDDTWFEQLARFVCDGLAACGFIYCPGDNMATNPVWRQPEKVWQGYFDNWIEKPEPKALLNACIFFDLDSVTGEETLLQNLRKHLLAKTKGNTLFVNYLTKNALQRKPPLGFFRDFVLKHNGSHYKTLDLKKNGIAPIVDLARFISLSLGIDEVNTIERIKKAATSPILSKGDANSLLDAYVLLTTLRLNHQAKNFEKKLPADNYLSPKSLSKLERDHLKDAFKVVKSIQDTKQAGLNVFG